MQPNMPQIGGPQQPTQEPQPEQPSFYTPPASAEPPQYQPTALPPASPAPTPASVPTPLPAQAPTPMPAFNPLPQTGPIGQTAVAAAQPAAAQTPGVVSWQASEYIHRSKDAVWVISFVTITVVLLGLAIWLQAWFFAVLILVMAAAMGYIGFRPPQTKQYTLSHDGLQIDNQLYHFDEYRAFGVVPEEAVFSVQLIPIKRFMPAVTVYFAEADGERIVDLLGEHLPMEQIKPDAMDSLTRRLHF